MPRPNVPYEPNPVPSDLPPRASFWELNPQVRRAAHRLGLAATIAAGAAAVFYFNPFAPHAPKQPAHPTTMTQELDAAYKRLDITDVKNTGKIVLASDGKTRQIIDFTVNGELNPVADEPGTPDYTYMPISGIMRLTGGANVVADVMLTSDAGGLGTGAAEEAVDLTPFAGHKTTTEYLDVYANNMGVAGNTVYDAGYAAGTIEIQGHDGHVTSATLAYSQQQQPPVEITTSPADVITPSPDPNS